MDEWKALNETSDTIWKISQMSITCMQKVFLKTFLKKLGEYHDLYFKSDALLLADVFENFRKMYLKIYHLDSLKFISGSGLVW